ncbi:MAG: universal stress protein [Chloroflexi bacterium]|nr:universal stress protein [Chloroflexota bacterium]
MTAQPSDAAPRVLVALDGSPAAVTALPVARVVADQLGARVEILYIAPDHAPAGDLWERLQATVGPGEALQVRRHAGEPAPAILAIAEEPGIALLVLTTHGRAIEPGRPLGHVAEAVIANTTRPILLVRPEAAVATEPRPLRHLLLPLDGSPATARVLRPAMDLARQLGARIDILYVAGPYQAPSAEQGSIGAPRYLDQPHHEWPRWATEVRERLGEVLAHCPSDVELRVFLASGESGPEIARFAETRHHDAIVLARRSRLEPGRAVTLRTVLDWTPCPILLVGAPPAEVAGNGGRDR